MSLSEQSEFDAIIIGGGVIGLSIARELKVRGVRRVAVFERNDVCGMEASHAAAGMLAPQAEADAADNFFDFCQHSRNLYPQFAAELLSETGVDIELEQTGTLYLAFRENDLALLERRWAWQQAAGLPLEKLTADEILRLEPNVAPNVRGGLRFPLDWQVENHQLVAALCRNQDFVLINHTISSFIVENNGFIGVKAADKQFYAAKIIVAAGAWSSLLDFPSDFNLKIEPVRGQIIEYQAAENLFRHVIHMPRGYLVPRRSGRILVGATVENVGFNRIGGDAALNSLLNLKNEIAAAGKLDEVVCSRLNFRPKTLDGLPLLGEFPAASNLIWATGHYRNGILLAPMTAKIIADNVVSGVASPFLKVFNPNRFRTSS